MVALLIIATNKRGVCCNNCINTRSGARGRRDGNVRTCYLAGQHLQHRNARHGELMRDALTEVIERDLTQKLTDHEEVGPDENVPPLQSEAPSEEEHDGGRAGEAQPAPIGEERGQDGGLPRRAEGDLGQSDTEMTDQAQTTGRGQT